ncbi:hypothetical protein CDIK_2457 [Cucumispora dikerogammari]|nr:hypothetical protein CDIK_2457 [Cucumispora dikerogammari]
MFLSTYILVCQQILCPESNNEKRVFVDKFNDLLSKADKNYKIQYHIIPFCFFIDKLLSLETDSKEPRDFVYDIFKKNKINKDGKTEEENLISDMWINLFKPINEKIIEKYPNFSEPLTWIISFELYIRDIYLVLNQLHLYCEKCKNTDYEIVKSYFNSLNFTTVLDRIKQSELREKCKSIVNEWATKHKGAFEEAFEQQKEKKESYNQR